MKDCENCYEDPRFCDTVCEGEKEHDIDWHVHCGIFIGKLSVVIGVALCIGALIWGACVLFG